MSDRETRDGEALTASEQRYRILFDRSPIPTFVFDFETLGFLAVNDALVRLLGYSRDELLAFRISDVKLAEDVPILIAEVGKVATGAIHHVGIRSYRCKDGRAIPLDITAHKIVFEGREAILTIGLDVAEHEQAQATLRVSELRYRALFDASPIATWVFDLETLGFLAVNETLVQQIGYARDELLAMRVVDAKFPEDNPILFDGLAKVPTGQTMHVGVRKFRTKTGRELTLDITAHKIVFDGREAILTIGLDIGERVRAQAVLQASDQRYRALFDRSPLSTCVFEVATLRFLAVNDSMTQLYGYSRDELLQMKMSDIKLPEEVPKIVENVRTRVAGVTLRVGIRNHRAKDGRIIAVDITSHKILFEGHSAILMIALDVTEREQTALKLRVSEQRYHTLFDGSPLSTCVFDIATLKYLEVNNAMVRMSGYSRDELLTMRMDDVSTAGELPIIRETMPAVSPGRPLSVGIKHRRCKDGSLIALDVTAHKIMFEGREAMLAIGVDVSERHKLEEELRQAQKMEAIGQLAGGVAHDFNNILAVIMSNAYYVREELGDTHRLVAEVREIEAASERAAVLTRQLLAFSRKQPRELKLLALNAVVTNLEKMLSRIVGEDIAMTAILAPQLGSIEADAGQIEQVLMNLVVNARDAMPTGGKLTIATTNCTLAAAQAGASGVTPGEYVRLAVSDTGSGIDPAILTRVFEPFFTTKEVGKGTGLGLSMVFGIVKQSGGGICIESELGHGTTFVIYLPRISQEAEQAAEAPRIEPLHGTEMILLVEDDPMLRRVIRRHLTSWGYKLVEAPDGVVALTMLTPEIDLLLTDLVMPGMDGRTLAARVRALQPRTKIVLMSGYSEHAAIKTAGVGPDEHFVHKPFSAASLSHALRRALD